MINITEDKWFIQLRKGLFELLILHLLNSRPMYGYELSKALKEMPNMAIAGGAIYPILKRMAQKEWVSYYWDEAIDGPRRKYYKITKEGKEILTFRIGKYKETYNLISMIGEKED